MEQASKTLIYIEPMVCISIAVMLLIVPATWVVSWLCAVLLHEFLHCLSLYLLGYHIYEIQFCGAGASITSAPMTTFHMILCAAAGPFGSLIVLPFSKIVPKLALCVLIQSTFNLLPIYPLDGGRILQGFLSYMKNKKLADLIATVITWFVISIVSVVSVALSFGLNLGIVPLLIPAFLLVKTQKIKIPCKRTLHRVQ